MTTITCVEVDWIRRCRSDLDVPGADIPGGSTAAAIFKLNSLSLRLSELVTLVLFHSGT